MDKKNMKKYAVIEIQDPPHLNIYKYQCIPSSWIRIQELATDDAAVIKYPIDDDDSKTKSRVKRNEPFSDSWPIFVVSIKHSTDTYKEARRYIKKNFKAMDDEDKCRRKCSQTHHKDKDAAEASDKTTSRSKTIEESKNKNKNVARDKHKEQEVLSNDFIPKQKLVDGTADVSKTRVEIETDNIHNSLKYLTTQLQKALSNSFETLSADSRVESSKTKEKSTQQCKNCKKQNDQSPDFTSKPTNPETNRRTVFQTSFIESLKACHSNLNDSYDFIDKLHTDFKTNLILMEKMIQIVEKFNNVRIDDAVSGPDQNNKKDKNIGEESKITSELNKKSMQSGDHTKLQEKSGQTGNTNNDNDVNKKNIDESIKKKSDTVESVKTFGFHTRPFTLPEEYNENDSRWTLRHQRKKKGLVELLPFSNIFVDAMELKMCVLESRDCKSFARKLLYLIFTENALNTCSWSGKKERPPLDQHAKKVMFLIIDEYASKYEWDRCDNQTIIMSLRSKMQGERDKVYKKITT